MRLINSMTSILLMIAVICTIAVPVLLAAACVRAFAHKSVRYMLHGALIMLILAVSAFILSSMLGRLT